LALALAVAVAVALALALALAVALAVALALALANSQWLKALKAGWRGMMEHGGNGVEWDLTGFLESLIHHKLR
jgi:hypothetical protein